MLGYETVMRRLVVSTAATLASLALILPFAHCSSIPSYEATNLEREDGGAPPSIDDADPSPQGRPDSGPAADAASACVPTPSGPRDDADTCRWATPLAWSVGSVRFGTLDSPAFAVTANYLFFVAHGQLWRVPRSEWLEPGGEKSFERCNELALGAIVGDDVQQILPFDTDGVCIHVRSGGRNAVSCAANGESSLRAVPGLGPDDADAGAVAADWSALTTWSGQLVFVRASGDPYRYAVGDTAPVALVGSVIAPDSLGPLSATPDAVLASRFNQGGLKNLLAFDPIDRSTSQRIESVPWPDDEPIVSIVGGGPLLGRAGDGRVQLLEGAGTVLFAKSSILVGARTGRGSFAVTVPASSSGTPATYEIVTPDVLEGTGENESRHHEPALLAVDKHRAVIDGDDLFVSTMPPFGCAPGTAWIAKLPRLLQ